MTPKSLLRLSQANSSLEDLSTGTWRPVLDDPAMVGDTRNGDRLVLCTGKVYYDMLAEAEKMGEGRPAIVRLEQLYSFPWTEMRAVLGRYGGLEELVWVQEEPRNMGAWTYLEPKLRELAPKGVEVGYVGRPERASPAEGYPAAHAAEQSRIIREALQSGERRRPDPLPTVAAAGEAKG
jgi:2-oxoglutarate dehydrogenase complex dehydrogenase (E1) component-like enzyme